MNQKEFYLGGGERADDNYHNFCVSVYSGGELLVLDDHMYDWAEAHEVAESYRETDDEQWYFVSDEDGNPLLPSYRECREIEGYLSDCAGFLSPSESMALELR